MSSDCMVMVSPQPELEIVLNSPSGKRYGSHLNALIQNTLSGLGVLSGKIEINDRGALDYCLEARIIAAIRRSAE